MFWDDFGERIRRLQLTENMNEVRKLFFLECCNTVKSLCVMFDVENVKHAELISLLIFNSLHNSGALTILEQLRTAKPRRRN
jgi:hypothetical protein